MRRRGGGILAGLLLALSALTAAAPAARSEVTPAPTGDDVPRPSWLDPTAPEAEVALQERIEAVRPRISLADLRPPGAAAPQDPTVAVSPSTGLVHGRTVTVTGTRWEPQDEVAGLLCPAGTSDFFDCEVLGFGRTGPQGRFRLVVEVDVVIDGYESSTDCRVADCAVGAVGFRSLAPVLTPVTFDPAGPDPDRHQLTVVPDTDLVDGQQVEASGSGYPPIDLEFEPDLGLVELLPCRLPVATVDADCDHEQAEEVYLERTDSFAVDLVVSPLLHLAEGTKDCRVSSCGLLALPLDFSSFVEYEPSEAGLAPLHFDPTAPLRPPPVTVVEPATDLVDGQVVHLAGSGFEPNSFVYVLQCPAGTAEPELCHLDAPIFARTDGDGRFEGYVSVLAVFEGFGGPVDCRVDGCSMVVAEDLFGRRSDTSLAFAPDGPLLDPSLTVTPHARLEGGDTVTVTGRSWPQTTLAVVQCLVGSTFRGCDLDRASFLVPGAGPLDRGSLRPVATTEATAGPGTSFVEPYDVRTGFGGREGEPVDCEVQPCELRVFAFSRELQRSVALGFRPGVVGPVTARPAFAG